MHANVEEDGGAKEEDIDQGKNIFVQKKDGEVVNKNLVLLDSQRIVDQFSSPGLITNIRRAKNLATIHCNACSTYSTLKGEFGSVTVTHNPCSIANVLSLNEAKQRHQVTYNSKDRGGVYQVYMDKGIIEFRPSTWGLYYHDMLDVERNINTLMLVNTVRENYEF